MTLDRGRDPRAPDQPDELPATLGGGRYLVHSLIGRGGSGEVLRAHDRLLGRPVALKVFPPGTAAAEDVRRWREVRTLAGLDHDRLVRIYDVGEHETRPFFVMQFVDGHNLHVQLGIETLDVPAMLRMGAGLASGLGHVHARGVVHRDVKPANVLLDGSGLAYLTDFGIATRLGAAAITEAGVVLGTAAYLAPEQVRGESVGPAADVYSLGLVLMESLTGRREYTGELVESAVARLHRRPEPPAHVPHGIAETLRAMTADDPADRPGAVEVAARLVTLLREHSVAPAVAVEPAPIAPSIPRVRRPRRRHDRRRAGWAVSALAAVLLAVLGATLTQGAGTSAALGATLAMPRPDLPIATASAPRTWRAVPAAEDGGTDGVEDADETSSPGAVRPPTARSTPTTPSTTTEPTTTTTEPTSTEPTTTAPTTTEPTTTRPTTTGPSTPRTTTGTAPDGTAPEETAPDDTPETTPEDDASGSTTPSSVTAPAPTGRVSPGQGAAGTRDGGAAVRTPSKRLAIGVPSNSRTVAPRSR